MANCSTQIWQNVVNRAIRMLASGPLDRISSPQLALSTEIEMNNDVNRRIDSSVVLHDISHEAVAQLSLLSTTDEKRPGTSSQFQIKPFDQRHHANAERRQQIQPIVDSASAAHLHGCRLQDKETK
ncbi:hypothetical protein KIN20_011883 [Parelaphostrongylus tenuis]|uniref:Uncharacterized protein n=1 Tax=Parelaphostrongylus tenuis TaxID=148309 RepID=A0AAD5MA35_PARTN|nr:hypothetical protein KIN20_011883 [Parelaphostrongylus tenuis]